MTVAVTGASGQLGRLTVEALLREGATPVAVVRDASKVADLAERGVEVREASYDDPAALDRAFAGVDRVLLVSGNEFGSRVTQHTNVIRAAERAGVELLAYTSIPNTERNELILAQEHRGTEAVLDEASVPVVRLRNDWYWENYLNALGSAVESGVFYGAAGEGRVAGASRADYAEAAAKVLTTDGHGGRSYELGGAGLTYAELAQAISEASGKPVRYQDLPQADYAAALVRNGVPAGYAAALADADAGIAQGILDIDSADLEKLLGREARSAVEVFRAALS
ncbi:NAD(P)H-binding protein [Nocardia sp. SYP-A9097]|uniref:SDR family oxidoreductase n=1 Tax=Nocardia sp. SYP-A9097 TaxID=2663237 RepID=UPI00129B1DE5|nr:SDR family oxidoreductase [Nocardia sp. SYP-A9097]MRH87243.1 NAD(P)H-binding protein [Nocardia sp. SYP-A9097]